MFPLVGEQSDLFLVILSHTISFDITRNSLKTKDNEQLSGINS
jgi:hypothetical protein